MSRKHYEENFKKQIVNIYNQGNHTYRSLSEEYGIAISTMRQWVMRYNNTQSFNAEDNRTENEKRIIELEKKLAQLEMENDILKQAALPHHRTDAILRRENLDRYDDRDDIRVNLIHSYERLMRFVSKHLNDKFYLEGDQRISLRDKIFREAISNLLIHREFASPFPAKLIIENDRVYIENSNKPYRNGIINPENFSPFPKNPSIAKFFKEIGWVEELGSGVRNIFKYNRIYSGADPVFIEEDIFKTIIPLVSEAEGQATTQATTQVDEKIQKLLKFCSIPRSRNEMQEFMNLKNREYFRKKILTPLIKEGLLKLTIPDKPTSPKQKYYSGE